MMYRGSFGIKIELAKTSLHFASIHLRHSDTGNNGNIVINVHIKCQTVYFTVLSSVTAVSVLLIVLALRFSFSFSGEMEM